MNRKIIFLHPHFLKPGGASRVVLELASRLKKMGCDVQIITIDVNKSVVKDYPGLNIYQLKGPTTGSILFWLTFPIFFQRLRKVLDNIDDKIIFSHSLAIYWGALYKRFNPKIISGYYFHDLGMPFSDSTAEISGLPFFYKLIGYLTRPIFSIINHSAINSADFLIANSKASADFVEKKYNKKIDLIVYPGIEINIFSPGQVKEDYVYTLGRLEKIKNIDLIIESFALFLEKNQDKLCKLKIIGEGIEEKTLKSLALNLGVQKNVDFVGRCTQMQIAEIAQKARLGIFLCPYESFGLAAIESMSCGTPVIGVNKGGISEIVIDNQTGILVSLDKEKISDSILYLLKDSERLNNYSINAAKHASEMYSWERSASKLCDYFKAIT